MMACQLQSLYKTRKMNKNITGAVLTGVAAGVAIYLLNKVVKGKKAGKRNGQQRSIKPKRTYAYEYSL